jgi:hypothetical protein
MLEEIESVRSTLKKTTKSRSPSPLKGHKYSKSHIYKPRSKSKTKSSQSNPMLGHLDNLKSTYQQKVSQISKVATLNDENKEFGESTQNEHKMNMVSS